jgi:hypothetical protein
MRFESRTIAVAVSHARFHHKDTKTRSFPKTVGGFLVAQRIFSHRDRILCGTYEESRDKKLLDMGTRPAMTVRRRHMFPVTVRALYSMIAPGGTFGRVNHAIKQRDTRWTFPL